MDLLTYYSDLAVAYPEYITQKQFCEVCGICHKTAYNLTRRGEISYEIVDTPTGRIHHIKLTDALAYLYKKDMETLRCRSEKAVRLFAELDSKKGIGLIERKRQGLGKPAIIYVKNFAGDIS